MVGVTDHCRGKNLNEKVVKNIYVFTQYISFIRFWHLHPRHIVVTFEGVIGHTVCSDMNNKRFILSKDYGRVHL